MKLPPTIAGMCCMIVWVKPQIDTELPHAPLLFIGGEEDEIIL